jgi:protein-disulfide isomerase
MHDKLFIDTKKIKRDNLDTYATELGLDMAKFKKALDSRKHKKTWQAEAKLSAKYGARGTPGFFINGILLSGAQPFPAFKKHIDAEIKAVDALLKKGVKADAAYATRLKANLKEGKSPAKKGGRRGDDNARYKVPIGKSPMKGPADALVTVVEWSDFQ